MQNIVVALTLVVFTVGGVLGCPSTAFGQKGFGKTVTDGGPSVPSKAKWAGPMRLHITKDGAPKPTDKETLTDGGLNGDVTKFLWGGTGPDGETIPSDSPNRHNLWEIPLHPGTFEVKWDKLPDLSPTNIKGEVYYLTVSFNTPDNAQYLMVYGEHAVVGLEQLLKGAAEKVTQNEVWKLGGSLDKREALLSKDNQTLRFKIDKETRVFFTTTRIAFRKENAGRGSKSVLDPGPRPRKYKYTPEEFKCPIYLRWLPDREVYRLEIESYKGEFDLTDWMVTVDYIE